MPAGKIVTLMGPNGAGKTTAFNAIGGYIRPTAGSIRFAGQDIGGMAPDRIAAVGISRTFQNNGILREMTVLENVLIGLELSISGSLPGSVLCFPATVAAERNATMRAHAMLERMGIGQLAYNVAGDLSFGQQRLVEISRALVSGARLLMLDEPAVGLSPAERINLGDTIRQLVETGITVLLVEHVQDLVMAVSDSIIVLKQGRKIVEGTPTEIQNHKEVLEVYFGHA